MKLFMIRPQEECLTCGLKKPIRDLKAHVEDCETLRFI